MPDHLLKYRTSESQNTREEGRLLWTPRSKRQTLTAGFPARLFGYASGKNRIGCRLGRGQSPRDGNPSAGALRAHLRRGRHRGHVDAGASKIPLLRTPSAISRCALCRLVVTGQARPDMRDSKSVSRCRAIDQPRDRRTLPDPRKAERPISATLVGPRVQEVRHSAAEHQGDHRTCTGLASRFDGPTTPRC